jgi:hypothetical protein
MEKRKSADRSDLCEPQAPPNDNNRQHWLVMIKIAGQVEPSSLAVLAFLPCNPQAPTIANSFWISWLHWKTFAGRFIRNRPGSMR